MEVWSPSRPYWSVVISAARSVSANVDSEAVRFLISIPRVLIAGSDVLAFPIKFLSILAWFKYFV